MPREVLFRQPLTRADFAKGIKYFGVAAGFLFLTLTVQRVDVLGYVHWIPECFGFFFIGKSLRLLVSKLLALSLPFLLIVTVNLVLFTSGVPNALAVLFEALGIFGASYLAGYFLDDRALSTRKDRKDAHGSQERKQRENVTSQA